MAIISIIVAVDENNAIGKCNQLLCYLPNDLKYFKSATQGHTIIMGRKTYESLPNGALPNRRNIVLSRNPNMKCEGCELALNLEKAIELSENEDVVFIIGGASVYRKAINIASRMYVTYIHHSFEGADTFFPTINRNEWEEVSRTENPADDKNKYSHSFVIYNKRQNL